VRREDEPDEVDFAGRDVVRIHCERPRRQQQDRPLPAPNQAGKSAWPVSILASRSIASRGEPSKDAGSSSMCSKPMRVARQCQAQPGRKMDFETATSDVIAEAIVAEIGREVDCRDVETTAPAAPPHGSPR